MWIGGQSIQFLHHRVWPLTDLAHARSTLAEIKMARKSGYPWIGLDEIEKRAWDRIHAENSPFIDTDLEVDLRREIP